jgi:GTP-binding protein
LKSIELQIQRDNEAIASGATLKDLAFVGRSNVGKSSLVNIILGGNFAQTSKSPGKTKTLTLYSSMLEGARIVDCPGYGFAQVGHREKESWRKFMETYLRDA